MYCDGGGYCLEGCGKNPKQCLLRTCTGTTELMESKLTAGRYVYYEDLKELNRCSPATRTVQNTHPTSCGAMVI